jgi:hypothetical protein
MFSTWFGDHVLLAHKAERYAQGRKRLVARVVALPDNAKYFVFKVPREIHMRSSGLLPLTL